MSKGRILPGEALRSSGLPLEFAVSAVLSNLDGVMPKGRYFYEKEGTTFETDLWAMQQWEQKSSTAIFEISHILLLECEHRTENKHWCFFPQAKNVVKWSENAVFGNFIPKQFRKLSLRPLEREFFIDVPIVGDGIELYENEKGQWNHNSQAISNAIRQATMPIGDMLPGYFFRSSSCDWQKRGVFDIYTPIIVTTAKIQVLKDGIGWEELSKCSGLEECFQERQSVFSVFTTPTHVRNYWRGSMWRTLRETPSDVCDSVLASHGYPDSREGVGDLLDTMVRHKPTRVLITGLDSFKTVIKKYLGVAKEETQAAFTWN